MAEPIPQRFPQLNRVDIAAPFGWMGRGLDDMRACLGASLFYGVCFTAMGYLLAFVLRHEPQYLAAVTAGFLLLTPSLAIGLYDLSRRRERGEPCSLLQSMTAWRSNIANIGLFSMLLLVVFLVWARASLVTFAMFFSGSLPTIADLMRQILVPENYVFLAVWLAVGFLFANLVFAVSVVSVPLMMDRQCDAITAVLASIQVVFRNPLAMGVWAAIIAWATAAGLLMGFIGIIVVGPLLGHATWHAYRELVGPAES